ncbi:MAG: hypothetical protein LBP51_08345 [Deferribacteraceae bacterium]|jgi:hypothetical protein|nr:hypothetical protein [Deferribacteraceae bacterium]
MNTIFIVTIGFVVLFVSVIIAVLRLDRKLKEDHLKLAKIAKTSAPYTAIISLKEVNDRYQIMIDGRLLSTFLMDRGDELPNGFSAPVRLSSPLNQLKVMELADKVDVWFPCLAPADDLSEDTVYAYVEQKDGYIQWSKFAYDEGRVAINAPPIIFDSASYNLFIQRFVRVAEVIVDKY